MWNGDGVTGCGYCSSFYPDIADDGGSGVVVTWNNTSGDIFARRINAAGNVLWNSSGIYVSWGNDRQLEPKIVPDGTGGAVIVWDDYRNTLSGSTDIYAQKITTNGTLGVLTAVVDNDSEPSHFVLYQNFPNPVNNLTVIRYSIPVRSHVSLKLFNSKGTEVATLVNDMAEAGTYSVNFEASGLSAGVYFFTMEAGKERMTRTMVISREKK